MNVLLDTCAFVWAISDPAKLSDKALEILRSKDTSVFFSPITCAEIACLADRGRLVIQMHWKKWFDHHVSVNHWQPVDITVGIIQDAFALPGIFHDDPADRIILATARMHELAVITADAKLLDYAFVNTAW